MNQLPVKNERDAFDEALPADGNEQELGALSLSGTYEQSVQFLNSASQFGAKVVQFAVKPVIDYNSQKISKRVLASMAGDPDPGKTLADIRSLLVGPTRSLHDAMFEEVIDILEESDREVQNALQSLESNYYRLSDITDNLITASVESRDQTRQQTELFHEELQKSVAGQQEMLSEMFMAIDAKIAELSAQIDRKLEGMEKKFEAALHKAAAKPGTRQPGAGSKMPGKHQRSHRPSGNAPRPSRKNLEHRPGRHPRGFRRRPPEHRRPLQDPAPELTSA